ncbi:hypothetical protein ACFSUJ_33290 [Streptomyces lusitanus]|uniref:Integral membrane protein n=1 Tax=Streptomyces lusitanus TaxID=68232 RepID=A0ABU3JTR5_9ACTN|nr:hypothetical protein [Streptomyces lusitanus]
MDDRSAGPVTEALRITRGERRTVYGSAAVAGAAALLIGGGLVTCAFAASWDLFLEARRYAEAAIENEDSYVAYADQMDGLLAVACVVFPLLFLIALALLAWLLTAQAVIAAHAWERAAADRGAGSAAAPGPLTLTTLWRRTRPHLGAAFRVQLLTAACAAVPGVTWPTYHEPATVQFLLVGRVLPAVLWLLGLVLLARFSLAAAERVADGCSATAAMRRSWMTTRAARVRTATLFLLCTGATAAAFLLFRRLGAYVAHWAGLIMLATTDDNVWVTGVLVTITPAAVALVLLPLALAPAGAVLACWRKRLAHG